MKLHEYQAKELLAAAGIPTPTGRTATTVEETVQIAQELGGKVAIKAQVHVGGRGKAGGIKVAKDAAEAKVLAGQILGMKIKGLPVKTVLVEQAIEIEHEYYLGIVVDRANRNNTLMFSTMGGIDIEEVAKKHPDKIIKTPLPITRYSLPEIPKEFVDKLIKVYKTSDANLAEINPLVKTKDGRFIAADAKIVIDDSALFRQLELAKLSESAAEDPIEAEAHRRDIAYVRLPGNIGIIGNGAGLVMTTMDEVKRAGGEPASFLDIGGGAKADKVKACLKLLLMDPNIKGLFFNVFGGITRCDEVAKGIIAATKELNLKLPLVVRLTGTSEKEGQSVLAKSQLPTADTMQAGARKIVELIK